VEETSECGEQELKHSDGEALPSAEVGRCALQNRIGLCEAKVVSPQQMIAIFAQLAKPETKLEWALALVHGATDLRPEECFALIGQDPPTG
jgi:hypothetical protein